MEDSSTILIRFGDRVRELRKELDISQEELSDKAGFDRTYISGLERGRRNISLKNIQKLASFFNLSLSDFTKGL